MDMKQKRKNTEILNYFIMVINVRAGHGHCSPVFNKKLLIQQRRFEFIMQFFFFKNTVAATTENRKSKFASIDCEHGCKIGWTTSMARWRQRQFLFIIFSSVCCHLHLALAWFSCTLNSRTPRIYMLMMVCWLTKLLQKDKYKKKKAHTHFGPGFNVALSGIMLRFMTTSHVYFQMNLFKKGATTNEWRIFHPGKK